MALNIKLLRFLLLLFPLFSLPFMVEGQSTKSEIDFTKLSGWGDYRQCVQGCFTLCMTGGVCMDQIGSMVGCSTNKCLCGNKSTYQLGIDQAGVCIGFGCDGNEADQAAATTLMTDYCAAQGYDYGSESDTSSDPTPEDSSTTKPSPTSSPSPTTTPVESTPTDQDESKPTTTTTDPSTTKDDSSQTPDETNTKDQPTETTDSSSGGKKGSDFGTSEIIGTVVGVVSLIITALGVFIAWRRTERKKRNNAEPRGQVAHIAPGVAPPPPPPIQYAYTNIVNGPAYNNHVHNPHNGRW